MSRIRKLPKDAYDLLLAKRVCFSSLSDALQFRPVDLAALRKAKKIFEKWHLTMFIVAVNSLENFIYGLSGYKSLGEIPEETEKHLLQVLASIFVLDGKLTDEIGGKIRGRKHHTFKSKGTEIKKEPKLINRNIAKTEKEWVRFCLVQLDFSLKLQRPPDEFGYFLQDKNETQNKVFKALDVAREKKADIVVFPELSFNKDWVQQIQNQYEEMIIIGGSYYDEGYNVCSIIINGEYIDPPYRKYYPSPFENPKITGRGMKSGDVLYIFQTKCGIFSVLTCSDYASQSYRVCRLVRENRRKVDFIINPCCDENILRFQPRCNSDCEDYNVDIIQVNKASKNNKYGESCIIGKEHQIMLDRLINEGYKPSDNIKYKFFQLDLEMMIIADLNIGTKGPPVSLPINYSGRIRISKNRCYRWERQDWAPLSD